VLKFRNVATQAKEANIRPNFQKYSKRSKKIFAAKLLLKTAKFSQFVPKRPSFQPCTEPLSKLTVPSLRFPIPVKPTCLSSPQCISQFRHKTKKTVLCVIYSVYAVKHSILKMLIHFPLILVYRRQYVIFALSNGELKIVLCTESHQRPIVDIVGFLMRFHIS